MFYTLIRKEPSCLVITTNRQNPHETLRGDYDYIVEEKLYEVTPENVLPFRVLNSNELYVELMSVLDDKGLDSMTVWCAGSRPGYFYFSRMPIWYASGTYIPYPTYTSEPDYIKASMIRNPDEYNKRIEDLVDLSLKNYMDGAMGTKPTLSQERPVDDDILGYVVIPVKASVTPILSFSDTRDEK